MKLKKECVRDVLKYLENNLQYNSYISANEIKIKKYSIEDILYTCEKLSEAGFINVKIQKFITDEKPLIMIFSISYEGHQFLDNIRSNEIWKQTKATMEEVGSFSINVMSQVASNLISAKLGI